MAHHFEGFPPEGLQFLTTLGTEDKTWLEANRSTYDQQVVAPTKAFVTTLGQGLAGGMAPAVVALPKTNGSIAPINNDLRFNPDRNPYKDHLLLRFWEGPDKKTAPTLFVRLSAHSVGFATGAALPNLDRWRALIDDDTTGAPLAAALAALAEGRHLDVAGQGYRRVPKPYPADHPRAELLRHKSFQARWSEPTPPSVTTPAFVDHCLERLEVCADIHHWLVTNLT